MTSGGRHRQPDYATPGEWATRAACHNHDMADSANTRICAGCPVRTECLTWAMTEPDPAVGLVAGGYTTRERRRLRGL